METATSKESESDEIKVLRQIMEIAEQSDFKAISLQKLREITGPVMDKMKGQSC